MLVCVLFQSILIHFFRLICEHLLVCEDVQVTCEDDDDDVFVYMNYAITRFE